MNITIAVFAIIQSERSNKILRPKRSLVEKMCVVFDVLSRMFERPWHGVQRLLPPKEGAGWARDRERLKTKKIWYSLAYFPGFRKISNWFCTRPYFGSEKWRFLFFSLFCFSLVSYCCGMANISHSISTTVGSTTTPIFSSTALQLLVIYSNLSFVLSTTPFSQSIFLELFSVLQIM